MLILARHRSAGSCPVATSWVAPKLLKGIAELCPSNNRLQRPALRGAAEPGRWAAEGAPMARAATNREALLAIARHNCGRYWYPADRAVSGCGPDCIGPFAAENDELAAKGLIEVRLTPDLPGEVWYWLNDAVRVAVDAPMQVEPDAVADRRGA